MWLTQFVHATGLFLYSLTASEYHQVSNVRFLIGMIWVNESILSFHQRISLIQGWNWSYFRKFRFPRRMVGCFRECEFWHFTYIYFHGLSNFNNFASIYFCDCFSWSKKKSFYFPYHKNIIFIPTIVLNFVIQTMFKSETTLNKDLEKKVWTDLFLRIGEKRKSRGDKFS